MPISGALKKKLGLKVEAAPQVYLPISQPRSRSSSVFASMASVQERVSLSAVNTLAPDGGTPMSNPWMSLWLSAANSWAGAMRGVWTAEMHRQRTAVTNEMMRQSIDFWVIVRCAG